MAKRIEQMGALVMVGVALGVLAVLALVGDNDAKIALVSVVSAGIGYFLRGKVAEPR